MNLSELSEVGHRLLVEPTGITLTTEERELLTELKPLSFMFRARNFDFKAPYDEWLDRFKELLLDLRRCVGERNLLLSIDHEGGRVVRPPRPITRFPYAAKWGEKVAEVAEAMAAELKSLGLNVSWAPVADVLTNKESKAIGQRAFSGDPAEVTRKSVVMSKTLDAHGVFSAAKHFPGYGPVTEDAHYDLPTAAISRSEWETVHLPPFVELIKSGVRFVMTAHIMYPALDPSDQATLSHPILSGLLRDTFGFKGVVVADALGMGAIRDQIKASEMVDKALRAELDLFCMAGDSVDLRTARALAVQIQDSFSSGRVESGLFERSRARVQTALAALPQHAPALLGTNILTAHSKLAHELDPNDEWQKFQYIPKGFD